MYNLRFFPKVLFLSKLMTLNYSQPLTSLLLLSEDVPDLKLALTNCAALTWLNPHVYIDTLLLIGTVSIRFDNNFQFSAGASAASLIFFFSLAFGARLLSPLMNSRKAWQTLDVLIAFVMFALSYSMFLEAL